MSLLHPIRLGGSVRTYVTIYIRHDQSQNYHLHRHDCKHYQHHFTSPISQTIVKKLFLILCEMNIEYNTTICHKTRTTPELLTPPAFMTWWVLLWCVASLGEGKVICSGWELTEPSLFGVPSQTCAFFSVTFWMSKFRSWRIYCNFSQSIYLKFVATITTTDV